METIKIPEEVLNWIREQKQPFAIFYNLYITDVVWGSAPYEIWVWYLKNYGRPEDKAEFEGEEFVINTEEEYRKFVLGEE